MIVTQIQGEKSTNNSELQFRVLHEVNEEEAEHALSLNNYHHDGNGDAPYGREGELVYLRQGGRKKRSRQSHALIRRRPMNHHCC